MAWPQPSPCGKRHHAIDVRRQRFAVEAGGDQLGGMRGAVAGGHHRDVVARAHAAVFALIAEEGRHRRGARRAGRSRRREIRSRTSVLRTRRCACGVAARLDGALARGRSPGRSAARSRPPRSRERHLVAGGNRRPRTVIVAAVDAQIVWPGESGTRATATLSVGCRWIAEFSAVGSLVISSRPIMRLLPQ